MKKGLLRRVILLVLLMPGYVLAQKNYAVTHYTSKNGLPQNSIKLIFADPEGFIWLGTEDGLVRFDGQHFYNFNRLNLNVSNNHVIFGRVVSKDKGLKNISPANRKSTDLYYASFLGWETVKIQHGRAVRDTLYKYNYLKKLAPFKEGFPSFHLAAGLPNFVTDSTVLQRYMVTTAYGDKNFFVCHKDQITYYVDWKKSFSRKFQAHNLWNYFSIGEELFYYEKDRNEITGFAGKEPVTTVVAGDIQSDPAYKTRKKDIILYWNNVSDQAYLCLGKNLYSLYKNQTGSLSTRLLVEDFDFVGEGIELIHFDEKSKKIFLGSPTEGLFVLSRQQFQVINIKGDARDNVFYDHIPYDENTVLTGTGNVIGKDMKSGRVTDRLVTFLNKINPADKTFVIRDKHNTYWIPLGTILYRVDGKLEKIIGRWDFRNSANRIHEGLSGKIWVSTYENGLFSIDPEDKDAVPVPFFKDTFPEITAIKSESAESLLLGTGAGLYRVGIKSKKKTLIPGTEKFHITSIYVDQDKHCWFTAVDHGIMLLGQDDKPVVFPLDKNKYLASPHYIIDDKRGYFWIPTNKGLFQIFRKDLLYYADRKMTSDEKSTWTAGKTGQSAELFYLYHAKEEGFNTNEFNGGCDPCSATLANGYISIPSLNGLVWFKPEQMENYMPEGGIVLDKVEVNQELLPYSGDTIRFNLNPGNVRFHFSTPYFGNPDNLNMSYALVKAHTEESAGDWIPIAANETDIRFSSLSSGEYTLLIRKIDGFGFEKYNIKRIHLIVPPRWYETWWAILFYVIALAAAIYGYSRLRLRKIEREKQKLEALVDERTEELNRTMLRLEESKNEMSKKMHVLSRLLASMTHDIQSPLNFVAITSSNIPPLLEAQKIPEVGKISEIIADSTRRMSALLKDLLNYIRVNVYGNRLQFEEIGLRALVEEKFAMFRNMMEMNNTVFTNNIPDDIVINSDLQMVSILIHNLIDNASKFTTNGEVAIYTNLHEDHKVEMVIANTATGIPQHVMNMINTPMEDKDDPSSSTNKAGLGLLIVKEVSDLVGVSIRVTDSDQTRFHLVFEY
ncbi:ATP-binding protein [Dyadobacter sp. CY345]|uniref:sensor histidine kinase n=1 Tax=Dyadobacter sp. CY345 TaxID=2909335 RepID=UPI001F42EE6E|nr:HAMP domain-containing sensor histidine kinase [Dyadobacter sp. CY345]MCF2445028.1 ATP-binding protein [Dyadobacter sp. CY345]